jgi:MFS transporter, DHA1 family, multidrug resistance protein
LISSSPATATSQKYLGVKGLIVFLALLSAFVPLSTDLYLPALPTMSWYFHVPEYEVNLTLILFFIFYSVATLVWGPLSDKYGRRRILLTGLTLYTVAGVFCAFSLNIYQLIFFRILQAAGAGAATAVATAIVKDVYQGKKRESVIALVQSMVFISPALAPVVGALLLQITSWRGVFVTQAFLGVVVIAGAVAFRETHLSRTDGTIIQTIGRLGVVLKNPGFTALLLIFSMVSITTLAFISSSSYIYQDTFQLSSQVYSYFFTFNALGMLMGPFIYMRFKSRFNRFSIINVCFAVMVLSGALVFALGRSGPGIFAVALLPGSIMGSCVRPPGTYLMLDQQQGDTGSASALIASFSILMGSVGMIIISFGFGNLVQFVGAVYVIFGLFCGGLWLTLTNKPFLRKVREP